MKLKALIDRLTELAEEHGGNLTVITDHDDLITGASVDASLWTANASTGEPVLVLAAD